MGVYRGSWVKLRRTLAMERYVFVLMSSANGVIQSAYTHCSFDNNMLGRFVHNFYNCNPEGHSWLIFYMYMPNGLLEIWRLRVTQGRIFSHLKFWVHKFHTFEAEFKFSLVVTYVNLNFHLRKSLHKSSDASLFTWHNIQICDLE